jgi:hypothetical protein
MKSRKSELTPADRGAAAVRSEKLLPYRVQEGRSGKWYVNRGNDVICCCFYDEANARLIADLLNAQ